jgi:hypothetical protein
MRSGDRQGIDAARGSAGVGVVWVLVAVVVGFLVGMLIYKGKSAGVGEGSGGRVDTVTVTVEQAAYLRAKTVTIAPTGVTGDSVTVNPFSVPLSKKSRDVAQWENTTEDTLLMLVHGAPGGELIPPHRLSSPFHVCKDCSVQLYPYRLYHRRDGDWKSLFAKGPPTEPSIDVGD